MDDGLLGSIDGLGTLEELCFENCDGRRRLVGNWLYGWANNGITTLDDL